MQLTTLSTYQAELGAVANPNGELHPTPKDDLVAHNTEAAAAAAAVEAAAGAEEEEEEVEAGAKEEAEAMDQAADSIGCTLDADGKAAEGGGEELEHQSAVRVWQAQWPNGAMAASARVRPFPRLTIYTIYKRSIM